jgi:uncharacterized protein YndB with AHSA1/START domain/uncharacterized protein YciI
MTISQAAARAVADVSSGVVLGTVDIAARPERVFQALTDPAQLARWWGSPETYRAEHWSSDLRVGGKWETRGRGRDGKPFSVYGEYVEVDPPRRLVLTWNYDWDGGGAPTTVEYALEPVDGGTRVTVRHSGFGERHDACRSHGDGWQTVLSWVKAYVEKPNFFLCRLFAPRPDFGRKAPEEIDLLRQHVSYWSRLAAHGVAIVFGPVADPKGGWSVIVLRAANAEEVAMLQAGDPVMRASLGFKYETLPMTNAVVAPLKELHP